MSDEQLREEFKDKLTGPGSEFYHALCMNENAAKGKDLSGADMSPEAKKEAFFLFHPDSRLICVHGKNRLGLDGVFQSEAEEKQHRNLWCTYNPCKTTTTTGGVANVLHDTGSSNPAGIISSASSSCCCLLAIVGLVSMFRS
jgi:hypothetical protein